MKKVVVFGGSGFIGKHLVSYLLESGWHVINADLVSSDVHNKNYKFVFCDINEFSAVYSLIKENQNSQFINLAANIEMDSKDLYAYSANTNGNQNILKSLELLKIQSRILVTSTQHVIAPGHQHDLVSGKYFPYLSYGKSKVQMEVDTKKFEKVNWTIVRPTTVWGPEHDGLASGLWRFLELGLFLHPRNRDVIRCYGYVKNIAWQMERMLELPIELVRHETFYLGDGNSSQREWINSFSMMLNGKKPRSAPIIFFNLLAYFGDLLSIFKVPFPLNTNRKNNLFADNSVPIEKTIQLLGSAPYESVTAVNETVQWYKNKSGQSRE